MELIKINSKNVWKIVDLTVNEDQKSFVATNSDSIIEAYVSALDGEVALPFGLFEDNKPVGFVMLGYGATGSIYEPKVAADGYCLWRFMIDKAYQKQGLGSKALEKVLEYIETRPCGPATCVWLSYEPSNIVAKKFYEKFDFVENGEFCGKEIVAVRQLRSE